jgi:general secretion pathway protein J
MTWAWQRPGARRIGRPRARQGFTLVEVLVALLIMGVIAGMGWQGVSAMARAREISAAASERTLRLSALVGQWEQDLQAVYDSPRVPGLHFDGAALRLVRRVDGGVQVVVWSLRDGLWRRWVSPTLDTQNMVEQTWMRSLQLVGDESGQLKLLDGVAGWQIYFYRGQAWANAQSSADLALDNQPPQGSPTDPPPGGAAPTAARTLLPTGVRLLLELPEGRLTRDVLMSPQLP